MSWMGGTTIVPVPYFSEEQCIQASDGIGRYAYCVPQPIEDVADYLAAQSGRKVE